MNLRKLTALILTVCTVFSLAACTADSQSGKTAAADTSAASGTTAAAEKETTVTDMIGRQVTVTPGSYKKVVCIGAGALRMYCYICDVSLLCGAEDIDNTSLTDRPKMFDSAARPYILAYGEDFKNLPSCGVGGPNAQTAEAEKILSCAPDIVISEYGDTDKANALQTQLGVPVITLKSGSQGVFADEFKGSLELLGKVFGKEERASELIAFLESESAEISRRTNDIPDDAKPSVYIAGLGNWGTTNHLMTCENYSTFRVANIKNAVSGLGMKGIGAIEEEKFVSIGKDIDIMIIDAAAVKNITPLYKEDPTVFDTCKAWQNGEVYLEMAYNAYYTNYEIALANTWFIAKTVYPEKFEDIDMTEKLNEITKAFLGKELASEIFACTTSFGGYKKIDTSSFFG